MIANLVVERGDTLIRCERGFDQAAILIDEDANMNIGHDCSIRNSRDNRGGISIALIFFRAIMDVRQRRAKLD